MPARTIRRMASTSSTIRRTCSTLRSTSTCPHGFELDGFLRRVGRLPHPAVPAYAELDVRLGWRIPAAMGGVAHRPEPAARSPSRSSRWRAPPARNSSAASTSGSCGDPDDAVASRGRGDRRALAGAPGCAARRGAEQRTATAEDDIKAAFLFNFTKFVEWPAGRPAGAASGSASSRSRRSTPRSTDAWPARRSGGRPIVRISAGHARRGADAARSCSSAGVENDRTDAGSTAVRGAPVLVVGESRDAVEPRRRTSTSSSTTTASSSTSTTRPPARAGLTISSKLLRVARRSRRGARD